MQISPEASEREGKEMNKALGKETVFVLYI